MTFILLDDARAQTARLYRDFICRETVTAENLDTLDTQLAHGFAQGRRATVRIPYAFGLALHGLRDNAPPLTLDWYARLDHLHGSAIDDWLAAQHGDAPAGLLNLQFDHTPEQHAAVIARIHEHIRAGDVYQINHTLRARGEYYGAPAALYRKLRRRQPAPYAVFAYHPDDGYTLCLSPELFLERSGDRLHTLPMKGTARAHGDIAAAKAALQNDPKNRAENLMIVDLLRNDLSRIARPFGVSVSDPFHVEQHGEVLQMTSRVNAVLREGASHADILRATFPCGSITGAPKRMAMRLIQALETSPRELYTGAIGYLEPERFCLNVAIRTLILKDGKAAFGVGAGITIDSTAQGEYREYRLKTAFLHAPPDLALIETLRVANGSAQYLGAHLARLGQSARALGIPFDRTALDNTLRGLQISPSDDTATEQALFPYHETATEKAPPPVGLGQFAQREKGIPDGMENAQRLKITLHPDGTCHTEIRPLTSLTPTVQLLIHPHTLPDRDPLRRHKTTHRAFFDRAWQTAEAHGAFDSLIFNDSGHLLEGGRSSVFVRLDGHWHTPPLTLDILPGIARAQILAEPQHIGASAIHETRLTRADLARAERLLVCNSLRGILLAQLADV